MLCVSAPNVSRAEVGIQFRAGFIIHMNFVLLEVESRLHHVDNLGFRNIL
jgi:hypothetical protein